MNQFAFPYAFLLILLPFIWRFLWPAAKGLHGDALKIPFIKDLEKISIKSGALWQMGASTEGYHLSKLFWWLFVIWVLLVIAVARPQWVGEPIRLKNESRDIMLVLDISTSMLAQDFTYGTRRIDRLSAVKKTASDFIGKRANDRIGLILFGTRAYLQSPLTFDKKSVEEILWSMDAGMAGDSTSIGDALGLALKTLKDAPKGDNKVIILLTDGENNDGSLSMPQAVKLAAEEGIKTYTIGVGSPNIFFQMLALSPQTGDDKGLKELARQTKGQYFRAESTSDLQKVYDLIDKLEPTQGNENYIRETKDVFYLPLLGAVLVGLGLVFVMKRTL